MPQGTYENRAIALILINFELHAGEVYPDQENLLRCIYLKHLWSHSFENAGSAGTEHCSQAKKTAFFMDKTTPKLGKH